MDAVTSDHISPEVAALIEEIKTKGPAACLAAFC